MNLHEVAWTIASMISRREPHEFKLIMDSRVPYPLIQYVGRPVSEYVLHIPTPEKLVPDDVSLSPLDVVRLRVFRACVAHEACHIYLTNPIIYETSFACKHPLAGFASNLVEDTRVETFLAQKWAGIGRDIAFANAVAYLRFQPLDTATSRHKRILLAAIMQTFCGKIKGILSEDEATDAGKICEVLKSVRWSSDAKELLAAVESICNIASPEGVGGGSNLVLPHQDGKKGWEFQRYIGAHVVPEDFAEALKQVSAHMELDNAFVETSKNDLAETESIFSQEDLGEKLKSRIEEKLKLKPTRLRYVGFSPRDYGEYLRVRDKVMPLLKSIENQLAMVVTEISEIPAQPSGILDMGEAVQSVASETPKMDIFLRWSAAERGSAWAVLLDNSLSMAKNEETVREMAIVFAEVLKNLCAQERWGLYAFSDVFLVLKDFDEGYNKEVASRLGGVTCGGGTFLPDAVELALSRLLQRPESLKTLVVISDGQPQGYLGIEEAMKNTAKLVERSGVVTLRIGFKNDDVRYFRNNCRVKSIHDLPKEFIKQYLALASPESE